MHFGERPGADRLVLFAQPLYLGNLRLRPSTGPRILVLAT